MNKCSITFGWTSRSKDFHSGTPERSFQCRILRCPTNIHTSWSWHIHSSWAGPASASSQSRCDYPPWSRRGRLGWWGLRETLTSCTIVQTWIDLKTWVAIVISSSQVRVTGRSSMQTRDQVAKILEPMPMTTMSYLKSILNLTINKTWTLKSVCAGP